MSLQIEVPKTLEKLQKIIQRKDPMIFLGARTSTVLPLDNQKITKMLAQVQLIDLTCLPKSMVIEGKYVVIRGPVSWKDLRNFLHLKNLEASCWPTDQNALVLAGVATSATGERCFKYGTIRDNVSELKYFDHTGELAALEKKQTLFLDFIDYKEEYLPYNRFKNGPFPRFFYDTDLLIGTEGQFGAIIEAKLKVFERKKTIFILCPIEGWESSDALLGFYHFGQENREYIESFEFFDHNCADFFENFSLKKESDYIIFEIEEDILEIFFIKLESMMVKMEDLMVLNEEKFSFLRTGIPLRVNEYISQHKLLKRGTDVQVIEKNNLKLLINLYRDFSQLGVDYVLFGHLGDGHLHFNFMPKMKEVNFVNDKLDLFYAKVSKIDSSPFAEHGIGLLKKKFVMNYYNQRVLRVFKMLKKKYDPLNIFFPQGFMGEI